MAELHLRAYRKSKLVKSVILCGRNETRLRELTQRYSLPRHYLHFHELLEREKPFAVSVCLPPDQREKPIVLALHAGAHVLCEKPLALNLEEAQRIAKISQETNRRVFVGYVYRFFSEVQKLKSSIDRGEIGEVKSIYFHLGRGFPQSKWGQDPHRTLGAFGELGIHGLDLIHYLSGAEVVSVHGKQIQVLKSKNTEDQGWAFLELSNGALGVVGCSFAFPFFDYSLELVGTKKAAKISRGCVIYRDLNRDYSLAQLAFLFLLESLYLPLHYASHPIRKEIDYFLSAIGSENAGQKLKLLPDASEDLKTLTLCLEVCKKTANF